MENLSSADDSEFERVLNSIVWKRVNSLPNNKILDWSKLKAFADEKLNVTEKLKFVLGRVENIMGKGKNAGYQHFFLFPQCFSNLSFSGSLKAVVVWQRVKTRISVQVAFDPFPNNKF